MIKYAAHLCDLSKRNLVFRVVGKGKGESEAIESGVNIRFKAQLMYGRLSIQVRFTSKSGLILPFFRSR